MSTLLTSSSEESVRMDGCLKTCAQQAAVPQGKEGLHKVQVEGQHLTPSCRLVIKQSFARNYAPQTLRPLETCPAGAAAHGSCLAGCLRPASAGWADAPQAYCRRPAAGLVCSPWTGGWLHSSGIGL